MAKGKTKHHKARNQLREVFRKMAQEPPRSSTIKFINQDIPAFLKSLDKIVAISRQSKIEIRAGT